MNYTPEQIKLLQQAGIKIGQEDQEQLTNQQKIDKLNERREGHSFFFDKN